MMLLALVLVSTIGLGLWIGRVGGGSGLIGATIGGMIAAGVAAGALVLAFWIDDDESITLASASLIGGSSILGGIAGLASWVGWRLVSALLSVLASMRLDLRFDAPTHSAPDGRLPNSKPVCEPTSR